MYKRTISSFAILYFAVLMASAAHADPPNVQIADDRKSFEGGHFTESVLLVNFGDHDAVDIPVTVQPYNTVKPDPRNPGLVTDSSSKHTAIVTVPAHKSVRVNFSFSGADDKNWKWKYTDVYTDMTETKLYSGDIGDWSYLELIASATPLHVNESVPLFYPNAVYAVHDGDPVNFSFSIDSLSLPAGWALTTFNPAPGDVFTLADGDLFNLDLGFTTSGPTTPGQTARVDYTETDLEDGFVYHGFFGAIVVPEPEDWALTLVGLAALGAATRLRRRAALKAS
jgi:MYXO-CTERM domain-containing protein